MSRLIHLAAAAKQLNRTLFSNTQFEGSVMVGEGGLEVAVRGNWVSPKPANFAGHPVQWREMDAAA